MLPYQWLLAPKNGVSQHFLTDEGNTLRLILINTMNNPDRLPVGLPKMSRPMESSSACLRAIQGKSFQRDADAH